jgi:hypothetical protein
MPFRRWKAISPGHTRDSPRRDRRVCHSLELTNSMGMTWRGAGVFFPKGKPRFELFTRRCASGVTLAEPGSQLPQKLI